MKGWYIDVILCLFLEDFIVYFAVNMSRSTVILMAELINCIYRLDYLVCYFEHEFVK